MIEWLYEHVDQLVAASNFTIAIMMVILGSTVIYYTHKLWNTIQSDLAWIMIGVAAEAYGWAIHRFYWGLWRLARLQDDAPLDKWFIDNAYLSVIPSLMVVIGMVMILAPVCSLFFTRCGRCQHFAVVGFASFAMFWFIFFRLGEFHQPQTAAHMVPVVQQSNQPVARTIPPRKLSIPSL